MKFLSALVVVSLLFCPAVCQTAWAEVFILASGGHIEGLLLNPDQSPRKVYEIETKQGLRVTIDAQQVKKVINPDIVEKKSEEKDKQKGKAAKNKNAQEEIMKARGYKRYKGRWLSPQEIKSIEKAKQRDKAEKDWYIKIKRWRGWLAGSKSQQAQKAIVEIKDPNAIAALADSLASDTRRPVRLLFIEALFNINSPLADKTLARHALENPDEETRLSCLDYLKKRKNPAVLAYFAARLKNKNNLMVNRAGFALGKMGDPAAVPALINALITVHQKKVTSGSPGQTSAGFDNSGGGLSMGSTTKIYNIPVRNSGVLDALTKLTGGVNFEYEVLKWRQWLAQQNKRKPLDARRD